MDLITEVWANDIKELLYPDDSFMMKSKDDSAWENNGFVNKPQAGGKNGVEKNRQVYPAPTVQRVDTNLQYAIDTFTSTPTLIQHIEQVEVSYDKRQSLLAGHTSELNLALANDMLYKWAPKLGSNILRTTGGTVEADTPGATGNRKSISIQDFIKARTFFNNQNIPMQGRYCVLPATWEANLSKEDLAIIQSKDFRGEADIRDGELKRLFGFDIFIRGREDVLRYNAAGTAPIDPTTNGAATDNAAGLFWHQDFVSRVLGNIKVFHKENDPNYFGDVFSSLVRAAASKEYTNEKGILVMVEATAA